MTKYILAALLALSSAPAFGIPMVYGFDGGVDCHSPGCPSVGTVTARFTIDPTLDLNPAPDLGRYAATDLKITLAGLDLPIAGTFDVFVFNNEMGPFCGFGPGQQQRDRISLVGITSGSHVSAMFDVCNSNALTSDSLVGANLSLFGPFSTGPGEGLVLSGAGLLPQLLFPEALGNTTRIYALPPSSAVPEPSSLLLLAAAFGLLAIYRARLRRATSRPSVPTRSWTLTSAP
jgi:hypothetical protein